MTARSRYVLFDDLQVRRCLAGGLLRKHEPPVQEVLINFHKKALQKVNPVQDDRALPEVLAKQDHPPDG